MTTVTRGNNTDSYEYDSNGNMTCRIEDGVTNLQSYNGDCEACRRQNRLSSVKKLAEGTCAQPLSYAAEWDFAYDGDGVRTATLTTEYIDGLPQPVEVTQYYFGGMYEVTNGAVRKYYSFGGSTVALRDQDGLKYILTDHLGSVVAVTDEAGTLLSQQRYMPFGEVRQDVGTITQTDFGYTSQRALPEMGLMDYKARFYSATLYRFGQPDTLIPDPANAQAFNHYSYVLNNPINFNDPTGHKACEDSEGLGSCLSEEEADQKWERDRNRRQHPSETGEDSNPFPKTNEEWEELANRLLAAFASGSKVELYFTAAFMGGSAWSLTLITTSDGDLQLFYEHGFAGVVGPNVTLNYTRGLVFGLENAGDYEGGATSGAFGGTAFLGAWQADHGGKTWGLDTGASLGVSIPPLSMAHTTAEPIEGWGAQLEGSQVFVCRLMGMCGR